MPNGPTNMHFWTTHPDGETLPKGVYAREGVAFYAYNSPDAANNLVPIFRFLGDNEQHFWTQAPAEKAGANFTQEGVAFYVPGSPGENTIPIFRFYDGDGHHFWTKDEHGENLRQPPFHKEGVAFYALAGPSHGASEVWRFYAQHGEPGATIQSGVGYREMVIGKRWDEVVTYVNVNIHAVVAGEKGRTFEIASGIVLPGHDTGENKQQASGTLRIDLGPLGKLYARSVDGRLMVLGYRESQIQVAWKHTIEF
jgi:hypothetical protein